MIPITIPSMNAFPQARPSGSHAVLGNLTFTLGPMMVTGCTLARMASGELRIWFPNLGRNHRVVVTDPVEKARLVEAAAQAYRALTGRDPADTPLATASFVDNNHDPSRDAGAPRGHRC